MEGLPDDVVAKIAAFLQSRDLLACSAVNRKWREKFNRKPLWTPHLIFLEEYYNIQEKYKEMILCPPYLSSLQPLCTARERYIRDQCLRFNFKAGLFTIESFHPKTDGKVNQIINHLDKDGHYWLFLTFAHRIEVWNITNKPYFQTRAEKKLPFPVEQDSLYILDTKVILVYSNTVQVYSFEGPKFELIFQCAFFNDNELSQIDTQGQLKANFNHIMFKHIMIGNILISYPAWTDKLNLPTTCLHVWKMDTLTKLDAVKMPYERFHLYHNDDDCRTYVSFKFFKGDQDKVPLIVTEATGTVVNIFDLVEMRFLEIFKSYNSVQIYWSTIVDERVHVIAAFQKMCFFSTTFDFHGADGVNRELTKATGLHFSSHVMISDSGVHAKTPCGTWFIGVKEGRFASVKLLDNCESNKMASFVVVSQLLFLRDDDGCTTIWDLAKKCPVNELSPSLGDIDLSHVASLSSTEFPPKIIFPNTEGDLVIVLSFW
ncbi:uncharacterized protein LOC128986612 [Macrosteles quadrilineatus]|uniref:uncharacterized protein LOC128986612 n=1 Tax=Macrosteles quadrilineatus TaxID=74068 RepID=UPI0023E31559|nr:uncharacterized protein LOC128986612 [Macrosteles quadrilineatus]